MPSSMASDEELECRICRAPEEPGRPLFHPCKCAGSIKHTHEDCLVNWLEQSGTGRCEVCHHPFRFEPLYQPNTPRALPTEELVLGLLARARVCVVTVARVTLVLVVWLFLLPLGTCWTWYALFINSLGKLPSLIASRGLSGLVTDAFYGCLLSAGIVFVFLGVSSLREYIRHLPDDAANANMFVEDGVGDDDFDAEDDVRAPALAPPAAGADARLRNDHNEPDGDHTGNERPRRNRPNANEIAPQRDERTHLLETRGVARETTHLDGATPGSMENGSVVRSTVGDDRALGDDEDIAAVDDSVSLSNPDSSEDSAGRRMSDVRVVPPLAQSGTLRRRRRRAPAPMPPPAFLGVQHGDDEDLDLEDNASGSSVLFDNLYAPGLSTDEDDDIDDAESAEGDELGIGEGNILVDGLRDNALDVLQNALDGNRGLRRDGHFHATELDDVNAGAALRRDGFLGAEDDGIDGPVFANADDRGNGRDPLDRHEDVLLEEHNEEGGALFGLFELDPDEVPLEEMVGLRGRLRNLFDNAGTVLVSNAIFLGIFTLIPLLVGRLALRVASLHAVTLDIRTVSILLDPRQPLSTLAQDNVTQSTRVSKSLDGSGVSVAAATQAAASAAAAAAASAVVELSNAAGGSMPTSVAAEEPLVSYVDNLFVVLLGYGCISLCAFGYVIVNSLLRSRYPRLDTPMTRQVVRVLRYIATFVKIVVLILFEFGIFPLGCGWWLDICTLDLVNATLQSRTAFCREFPWTCTAGHWSLGLVYMLHISEFVSLLREVLRPELLWFLRDPDDPDFRPFRELVEKPLSRHARRMCLSVLIYAPLIVAIVYVPAQVCITVLPQVFPFNLIDFSLFLDETPLSFFFTPLVSMLVRVRPVAFLRLVLRHWIRNVGTALGIQHLVLKRDLLRPDEQTGNDAGEVAEGDNVFAPFGSDSDDDGVGLQRERHAANGVGERGGTHVPSSSEWNSIRLGHGGNHVTRGVRGIWARGVVMLLCGWVTMVLLECVAVTVPTVIGRYLMSLVGFPSSVDLYALVLGFKVLLGVSEVVWRVHKFLCSVDAHTGIHLAVSNVIVVLKGLFLALLWFGMAPLGAGVLVELMIIVPLRVSHDESPYLNLVQDWALGLVPFYVGAQIVLIGWFDTVWRERLERARAGGLLGVGQDFRRTLREVVGPVLVTEAIALALPYAFAHGLLPAFGVSLLASSYVYRNLYVWFAWAYVLRRLVGKVKAGLRALHDSIRDDKYLVGRRLYNYSRSPSSASG